MAEQNYKFIEEKIKPKKKRLIIEALKKWLKLILSGLVFGAVASVTAVVILNISEIDMPGKGNTPNPELVEVATQSPGNKVKYPEEDDEAYQKNSFRNFSAAQYDTMTGKLAQFAEDYNDTIVTVAKVTEGMDCFENPMECSDSFSGMVIRVDEENMYFLTRYDGLEENSAYRIYFRNGEYAAANVLGVDITTGLAVITTRLEDMTEAMLASARKALMGYSEEISIGDAIIAIGNPAGSMYSMSYGVVLTNPIVKSITDRQVLLYHTDLPYIAGAGGVVMNSEGVVIGILTSKFYAEYGGMMTFIGVAELDKLINTLISNRRMPYFGLQACNISDEYKSENDISCGIYITGVEPLSPAEDANLVVGDIITGIEQEPVDNVREYSDILSSYNPGDDIVVTIRRPFAKNNKERKIKVTLAEQVR